VRGVVVALLDTHMGYMWSFKDIASQFDSWQPVITDRKAEGDCQRLPTN